MRIDELGGDPSETIFDSSLRSSTTITFEPMRGNEGFAKYFCRSVRDNEIARHHFIHPDEANLNKGDAQLRPEMGVSRKILQVSFVIDLEQRREELSYRKLSMLVGIVGCPFYVEIDLHISSDFDNQCLGKFNRDCDLIGRSEVDRTTFSEPEEHHFDFIGAQIGQVLRFFINLVMGIFDGNVSRVNIVISESANRYVYLLMNTAHICGKDFFDDCRSHLKETDT